MSAPPFSLRLPPALREIMEAHARKSGQSLGEVILEACAERYMGHDSPAPRVKAAPKAKAPIPANARQALAQAEARVGVAPAAAPKLDTSMVAVFAGGKRPAYQKGQAGQGKARR